MPFPKDIREQALVASGRCCCLCHKFCGIKMEVHHVKQEADGGENIFENAIPLCLDCHAEVKSYNPRHPKGTAYTESELIKHRNIWYEKVKGSGGVYSNEKFIEVDKKLYIAILKTFPMDLALYFLKEKDFGYRFDGDEIKPMSNLLHLSNDSQFEFIDVDLESAKEKFIQALMKFDSKLAEYSAPVSGIRGLHGIDTEDYAERYPEKFASEVKEVNGLASQAWEEYDSFIKLAKRKLGILIGFD